MKKFFFLLLFLNITSLAGFAQYGRLEPLKEGDTSYVVLRTPKETIRKLTESADKKSRKIGAAIETIEKLLNSVRYEYLSGRRATMDKATFATNALLLKENDVDVTYYMKEYYTYYPRNGW